MAYDLEGSLFEVCTCNAICPCWIGDDPDGGECKGLIAYHIDRGTINGTDVAGHTIAMFAHIPGNVLKGNWKVAAFVDDKASDAQQEAILNAITGKLGGPLADQAQLIGEVMSVERAPIEIDVTKVNGSIKVGNAITAELVGLSGATGQTTLHDSIFSNIPGSPAYVGKSTRYQVNLQEKGYTLDISGKNAVHGTFRFIA